MRTTSSIPLLIGRLCLSAIFIITGIWKFANYHGVYQDMAAKGFPMVSFFLVSAAIVELIGGLLLFFGYKTRLCAAILMLYLIPVTLIFHDFWNVPEAQRYTQIVEFLKNLGIFGGLWELLVSGPGRISLDALNKQSQ
jgi:putative oxidoreductase